MNKKVRVNSPSGVWEGVQTVPGVETFLGIPFAKPPVGELRWRAPQECIRHVGVYSADKNAPMPIQIQNKSTSDEKQDGNSASMSEDCLYLNIWVSDTEIKEKSVLFWVYGGSYVSGHNFIEEYIGENFVRKNPDIIVVASNYRLGVLASLNLSSVDKTGEYRESNNLSLLDQRMAMKWVHDNISSFGGDPNKVTLFGHSAGSNAISYHLIMAESRKYFTRAICESSFFPDLGNTSLEKSEHIAETIFHLSGSNTLEDLMELTPEQLLEIQEIIYSMSFKGKPSKLFSPVTDGIVVSKDPFGEILNGAAAGINLMIGTSSGEYDQMFLDLDAEESRNTAIQLNQDKLLKQPEIIDYYRKIEENIAEKEVYMDLQTDLYLRIPGMILADACSNYADVYVFFYQLYNEEEKCRAYHGSPNPYIFGTTMTETVKPIIYERLMESWASFVRDGNPNHVGIPQWPIYTGKGGGTMVMDTSWEVKQDFRREQYELLIPLIEEGRRLQETLCSEEKVDK
jgi:para-nitrobenzyl esterase